MPCVANYPHRRGAGDAAALQEPQEGLPGSRIARRPSCSPGQSRPDASHPKETRTNNCFDFLPGNREQSRGERQQAIQLFLRVSYVALLCCLNDCRFRFMSARLR